MTGGRGEAFLENPSPHRSLPKTCVARFNGNARDKDDRRDAVFNVFVAGMDRDSNTAAGIIWADKARLVGLPRDQQL
jgi:hypothetical protein